MIKKRVTQEPRSPQASLVTLAVQQYLLWKIRGTIEKKDMNAAIEYSFATSERFLLTLPKLALTFKHHHKKVTSVDNKVS